ncbi:MAG TPA: GGDEF domain-containing protein [Treponemataceae bacterium]|nr:GGDEF domain-containing protein [Treponemataceae bacterium]
MSKYSTLINETGKIRGGIQRIVKLELAHKSDDSLLHSIDDLFIRVHSINEKRLIKFNKNIDFSNLLGYLNENWLILKDDIQNYRNMNESSKALIQQSEFIWDITNETVLSIETKSQFNIALYYIIAIISVFGILSLLIVQYIAKYDIRDKIEYFAQHDQLTGLKNRHFFNAIFEREISIAQRSGRSFAILMCDIDHFKTVNDTFGHLVGDTVLRDIAQTIKKESRDSDVVARFGGEEFVILCIEDSKKNTIAFAERIRIAITKLTFKENMKVTISIGGSFFAIDKTMNELLQEADQALYQAKENGRNAVIFYEK